MKYTLGLDAGTTSVSAVAVDEQGNVLEAVSRRHEADLDQSDGDAAEQSLEKLQATAQHVVRQLMETMQAPPSVVGLTGQMHGVILLDQDCHPVTNLITWQDRRCLQQGEQGISYLEELNARLPDQLRERIGCQLRPGYALSTLSMLQQRSLLPEKAFLASDVTGWLGSRLTGKPPKIDATFAASWGVYNLHERGLDEEIIASADFRREHFPVLAETGTVLGRTTTDLQNDWKLPAGTPVLVGIGDNQSAAFATLREPGEELLINIGTGGQIAWCSSECRPTTTLEVRPYLDDQYLNVGAGVVGGGIWFWFAEQVQQFLAELGVDQSIDRILERLTSLAGKAAMEIPPQERIDCEPFFLGTRFDPDQRGLFRNVGRDNFTLAELSRSLLAGIADALCQLYEETETPVASLRRIRIAGNFFDYHPWLPQLIADRMQVPVLKSRDREHAALGAARLAWKQV